MKVYVCFTSYNQRDYCKPSAVFDTEEKAKIWVAGTKHSAGMLGEYVCLEMM